MQTLDPRLGNQRKKALIAKVAQKAMAKKGYTSKVGTFGKLANAGKMTRGLRPNRGPGQKTSMARPGGYKDFLDGLSGGPGSSGSGVTPGYVNTAPTHSGLPDSYVNPVQNTQQPAAQDATSDGPGSPGYFGGGPNGYVPGQTYQTADPAKDYTTSGGTSTDPNVANAYNWGVNYAASVGNQAAGFDVSQFKPENQPGANDPDSWLAGAIATHQAQQSQGVPLQQSTPSAPISAPGGLIPLGGGRYYDPNTDRIMGVGTGGRGGV